MKNSKLRRSITCNYASSLGSSIRNSLDLQLGQAQFKDIKNASNRLEKLLIRMRAEAHTDSRQVAEAVLVMAGQMGILDELKERTGNEAAVAS